MEVTYVIETTHLSSLVSFATVENLPYIAKYSFNIYGRQMFSIYPTLTDVTKVKFVQEFHMCRSVWVYLMCKDIDVVSNIAWRSSMVLSILLFLILKFCLPLLVGHFHHLHLEHEHTQLGLCKCCIQIMLMFMVYYLST